MIAHCAHKVLLGSPCSECFSEFKDRRTRKLLGRAGSQTVRVGSLVRYIPSDSEKGTHIEIAHVLSVNGDGTVNIRWHRAAKPNIDVERVPYSSEPKVGHWCHIK